MNFIMPAEQFSGPEKIAAPKGRGGNAPLSNEELEAMAAQRRAEQAGRETAEAEQQLRDWPPKAEADLLAQLDDVDPQDGDDVLGDFLDTLDTPDAEATGDDLDAFLGDLGSETEPELLDPEARAAELEAWIVAELPDCRPADIAAGLCQQIETEGRRDLDPDYDATKDPAVPGILRRRLGIAEKTARADAMETVAANSETIDAEAGETVRAESVLHEGNSENDQLTESKAETTDRANSIEDLITPYNEALKQGGQRAAIAHILTLTDSPEIKTRLNAILATLGRIEAIVPEAHQTEVTAILNRAPLNLAGASVIDIFAPVLTAMEQSETLPPDTKEAIRAAVLQETYIQRGSDVRKTATERVPDPQTGEMIPRYTKDNGREIREGVTAFTESGDEVFVRLDLPGHPPVVRDVTGWSDDDIGLLTEAMGLSAAYEAEGLTGFVESVYEIDFSILGNPAFDRESLRDIRQMLSALMGTFEGYDGDIFDARSKTGLIHHQAQLLSQDGRAFGTEESQADTLMTLRKLGLRDADNQTNMDVMRAFGAYAQTTYRSGEADHADLHAHLYDRFPNFVEALEGEALIDEAA